MINREYCEKYRIKTNSEICKNCSSSEAFRQVYMIPLKVKALERERLIKKYKIGSKKCEYEGKNYFEERLG